MASQVDSAVLLRTRETLGKVIKKPPLTDKLLSRPPFRFLHDIVNEVNMVVERDRQIEWEKGACF